MKAEADRNEFISGYLEHVIDTLEKAQWIEERRDDALRTLKYLVFYLKGDPEK